jgi:threonine dehydrogenase-like Zn-dependent dehydrogenase
VQLSSLNPTASRPATGPLVIAPFAFSDGTCPHCRHGITSACVAGGFYPSNGDGGQGEAVRVPLADGSLLTVPGSRHSDEMLTLLLTLSDVMTTGHHAAVCADVRSGSTVAVVGDGAVGLSGVLAAKRLGAERIIALSRTPSASRSRARPPTRGPSGTSAAWRVSDGGQRHRATART